MRITRHIQTSCATVPFCLSFKQTEDFSPWFSRRVKKKKRCYDRQQSRLKLLIFLTGDFAFLQKPLHPCISQLLAGQALSGKHDREWRISLFFFFLMKKNFHPDFSVFFGASCSALSPAHCHFSLVFFGLLIEAITFSASISPSVYLSVQLKLAS